MDLYGSAKRLHSVCIALAKRHRVAPPENTLRSRARTEAIHSAPRQENRSRASLYTINRFGYFREFKRLKVYGFDSTSMGAA